MNSVSIAFFTALLGLLVIVRLSKMEYLRKSHFTLAILMLTAVGCTVEMLVNVLNWRVAVSWLLVTAACVILCINILVGEHYYTKNYIDETYDEEFDPLEEFQDYGEEPDEIYLEIPEDVNIGTKIPKE